MSVRTPHGGYAPLFESFPSIIFTTIGCGSLFVDVEHTPLASEGPTSATNEPQLIGKRHASRVVGGVSSKPTLGNGKETTGR